MIKNVLNLIFYFFIITSISKNTYAQGMMLNMSMWQQSAPMCSPVTFGASIPGINGEVNAIKVVGDIAYIGGGFTEILGQQRNRLAAVNLTTGLLTGFNPGFNDTVRSLEYDMGLLFVGGSFTSTQDYIMLDGGGIVSNAGVVNSSSPDIHGWINVSIPDGAGGWYVGGQIWSIGGEGREMVARVNSDGSIHAFNAGAIDGRINDIHLDSVNGILYIAGSFTSVDGQGRNHIAALDATTGSVTAWNPNADNEVIAIELSGSVLYAAGHFNSIGGQSRNYIAALDTTVNTNNATAWNPNSNGYVFVLAASATTVYAGGWFDNIGGQYRPRFAALDMATNTNNATAWDPELGALTPGHSDQLIHSMYLDGTTLYVGGAFSSVGNQLRNSLAALDTTININTATAWNPDVKLNSDSGRVSSMAKSGNTLYISGKFNQVGVQSRNHVAAVDVTLNTNSATAWNPPIAVAGDFVHNPYVSITGLGVSGTNIYIGAGLYSGGGLARQGLAAVDTTMDTNNLTAWNPITDGAVNKLLLLGTTLYASGAFQIIDGVARTGIAALDTTVNSGMVTAWNPTLNFNPENQIGAFDMLVDGNTMYLAGDFDQINGVTRRGIGAVDITVNTSNHTTWNPNATGGHVRTMALSGTTMYVGGTFTNIGGNGRNRIAALNTGANTSTAWNPNANGQVNSLVLRGSTIYAGGEFTSIGGQTRRRLAGLNTSVDTNNATSWNPNVNDGTVNTIKIHNHNLLAGGYFYEVAGDWQRAFFTRMCVPP